MTPKSTKTTVFSGTLPEVAAQLGSKTPIGAALNSAEWADVAARLREDAFFSASVESVRALSEMQRGLMDILEQTRRENGTMVTDRSKWVADMKALTTRMGLRTGDPDKIGGLQDIGSERRLKLIRDFQIESAQAKANHIAGQDEDVLQDWPAQELIRVVDSKVPRDWYARWQEAGAKVGWEGASQAGMVALKTSPIWMALSRFGRPYPPFDFNSGMDLRDIDREEAEAMGLVGPGEVIEPSLKREEEVMEAGLKKDLELPGMREALESIFGNQIRLTDDGRAVWRGGGDATARAAVGRSGDWKALNLRPVADIPPDPAPPVLEVEEARAKLGKPYEVTTPLGDRAQLGPELLRHWEEKGKPPADVANRLHFLPAAEDALRYPHEVWENDRTGTRTYIHVTKDATKSRVLHAWELRGGMLESFISTSDLERRGDKHREGKLLYAR